MAARSTKNRLQDTNGEGGVATLEAPANGDTEVTTLKKPPRGAKKPEDRQLIIPKADIRRMLFWIVGICPLIVHKFSSKQQQQIEEKQQQKARGAKAKRDPHEEFLGACYMLEGEAGKSGAVYAVPVMSVKNAIVDAARLVDGVTMQLLKCALHVFNPDDKSKNLLKIYFEGEHPIMRTDTVRLSGPTRALDLRYRPQFEPWGTYFEVQSLANVISPEMIANLIQYAGFGCGIGEWRAEKSGNTFGAFRLAEQTDFEESGVFFGFDSQDGTYKKPVKGKK
jgi:hypothetical protein